MSHSERSHLHSKRNVLVDLSNNSFNLRIFRQHLSHRANIPLPSTLHHSHPIDVVKTRLQVSGDGTNGARNYKALGIRGTVSIIATEVRMKRTFLWCRNGHSAAVCCILCVDVAGSGGKIGMEWQPSLASIHFMAWHSCVLQCEQFIPRDFSSATIWHCLYHMKRCSQICLGGHLVLIAL